jgi:hypothetical protein
MCVCVCVCVLEVVILSIYAFFIRNSLYSYCLKWKYPADCCRKDVLFFTSISRMACLRNMVCFSKYESRMCYDSNNRFYILSWMLYLCYRLQYHWPFQPKVLTALISYSPFSLFILSVGSLYIFKSSLFSLLHATNFPILVFSEFPPVSISSLCSFYHVYFLTFFLSSFLSFYLFSFVSPCLHFSTFILSFPLLLFLYVLHYFLLFV